MMDRSEHILREVMPVIIDQTLPLALRRDIAGTAVCFLNRFRYDKDWYKGKLITRVSVPGDGASPEPKLYPETAILRTLPLWLAPAEVRQAKEWVKEWVNCLDGEVRPSLARFLDTYADSAAPHLPADFASLSPQQRSELLDAYEAYFACGNSPRNFDQATYLQDHNHGSNRCFPLELIAKASDSKLKCEEQKALRLLMTELLERDQALFDHGRDSNQHHWLHEHDRVLLRELVGVDVGVPDAPPPEELKTSSLSDRPDNSSGIPTGRVSSP